MAKKARKKSAAKTRKKAKKKPAASARKKRKTVAKRKSKRAAGKKAARKSKGIIAEIVGRLGAVVDTLTDAERLHRKLEPRVSNEPE